MDDLNLKRLYALQKEDPLRVGVGNICLHCEKYFTVPLELGRAVLRKNPSVSLNSHCVQCYTGYLVLETRKAYHREHKKIGNYHAAGFFERLAKRFTARRNSKENI